MHKDLYNFFDNLSLLKVDKTAETPTDIWLVDDFLPSDIYKATIDEIKKITLWSEFNNYGSGSKRKECRNFQESPLVETISNCFNSSKMINWLENITGSEGLIPDPHLLGGGLCSTESGNKLDLHTDFNWNNRLRLNRNINLILYFTEEWNDEWNGSLEFWDDENKNCLEKLSPTPNRLIFWRYTTTLIHGFSEVLKSPGDIERNNLVHFYYTSNSTWDEAPRRSNFDL
jgi:Rps23 Pro-64 3,4-dihydroxylase Tpa1-like proline 4-hydroxylase